MTTTLDRMVRAMQASPAWPAVFEASSARTLIIAALKEAREPGIEHRAAMLMALGGEVNKNWPIPVVPDGRALTDDEAKQRYAAFGARIRSSDETDAAWRAGIDHILGDEG